MARADVILDVGTGVDDALAIMVAVRHPDLHLRAISCVAGNAAVDHVVTNTLTVLDHAGADAVPVARGAARPLLEPGYDARHVHGVDGMGDLGLPAPTRRPEARGAIEMLRERILSSPVPVTLVPLGPLTNIALLLRTHPEVAANLERIVFMGGSVSGGNASPVAEFNVWHDPEAAAIVLGAEPDHGVQITMYGLDVFYEVAVEPDTYRRLQEHPDPAARLAGHLIAHSHGVVRADPRTSRGGLIGDAGAVCAVADGSRLAVERRPVRVELAPGVCRGQTVVDRRVLAGEAELHGLAGETELHGLAGDAELYSHSPGHRWPLVDVAVGTDARYYHDLFLRTVRGGAEP